MSSRGIGAWPQGRLALSSTRMGDKTGAQCVCRRLASALAQSGCQPRRVEPTAKASDMRRVRGRRTMTILSAERNEDVANVCSGVLTLRIAEGGGVGEREASVSGQQREMRAVG